MLDAYKDSGETKFLTCAIRAGDWYERAVRQDGGLLRNTYLDFNTPCFGHATSGAACAAIFWHRLWRTLGNHKYIKLIARTLEYCMSVQFTDPSDPNLKGAILEKVLPPDGTDRNPYYIRDVGTIFFLQAAVGCLLDEEISKALAEV